MMSNTRKSGHPRTLPPRDMQTHTVRTADLRWAQTVLNSPSLSRSPGELYEALRTLVGFASPIANDEKEESRA